MISVPVATGITLMLIMYVLFLIGKALEARFPQTEPSYESGLGAPAPSRDAVIAALYARSVNDPSYISNFVKDPRPVGFFRDREGEPATYQIVDYVMEYDVKWGEAREALMNKTIEDRKDLVAEMKDRYQVV